MKTYLLIAFLLYSFTTNGQSKASKKEKLIIKTIGVWEFLPGEFIVIENKSKSIVDLEDWHTLRIELLGNMEYEFLFKNGQVQTGKWDISDNLKEIKFYDRQDSPPIYEYLPDITFPFKYKKGHITICYPLTLKPMNKNVIILIKYLNLTGE